jgi:hypothetical protein
MQKLKSIQLADLYEDHKNNRWIIVYLSKSGKSLKAVNPDTKEIAVFHYKTVGKYYTRFENAGRILKVWEPSITY